MKNYQKTISILSLLLINFLQFSQAENIDIQRSKTIKNQKLKSLSGTKNISAIWAIHDSDKILQEDISNPKKEKNFIWDGKKIEIFGARNEIVAFQIIIESTEKTAPQVSARLKKLTHASGKTLNWKPFTDKDPTDYTGREIIRFNEHYLNVTKPEFMPVWDIHSPYTCPTNVIGHWPDALIPFNAKDDRGGGKIDIPPRNTQGIWFDIFIPKDYPAGIYSGIVEVLQGNKIIRIIPISLKVFNFTLPDENHITSMFWMDPNFVYIRHTLKTAKEKSDMILRYHKMAKRHRVEFFYALFDTSKEITATDADIERIKGTAYTDKFHYEGPGKGIGNTVIPANMYGNGILLSHAKRPHGRLWITPRKEAQARANKWMDWINSFGRTNIMTFLYGIDELGTPSDIKIMNELIDVHHSNLGSGSKLPIITSSNDPRKDIPELDMWFINSKVYNRKRCEEARARGQKVYVYNGGLPYNGSMFLTHPPADVLSIFWANYKYNIPVWFYWHVNHWWHHGSTTRKGMCQNVWLDPVTYGGQNIPRTDGQYGEGNFIYPGEDASFPDQNRGVKGPVGSIRLKAVRRGSQDYEYLYLAEKLGLKKDVEKTVNKTVPQVYDEIVNLNGPMSWSQNGDKWEETRFKLAELIENRISGSKKPETTK
jgi:hypothetical protein